jgi:amino acid adenylation domain-containing protein
MDLRIESSTPALDDRRRVIERHKPAVAAASIPALFESWVASTEDALAVFDEREHLTFRELNARANQLAHHLRARGVTRETLVGISLERSIDTVVAVLGVLKAGGAFVPLDPGYPLARLTFMVQDCGARFIITHERLLDRLPPNAPVLCLDTERDILAQERKENVPCVTGPDDAAYVIYTSGTTGRPKGVVGLHRGAINRFDWMWQSYPFASDEVCCLKTNLSFVDSVAEIFVPLLKGVPTVVVSDDAVRDPHLLVDTLGAHSVTRLVLVPSLLRDLLALGNVLERRLAKLRICVSSGEALPLKLANRFRERLPHATLLNLYGSTEVSADVTCYDTRWLPPNAASVPLGTPIANTQVYILDGALRPVPPNMPGELFVGGDGLARGYLNRADLTAERFIPNPFAPDPTDRLYRTGDRARCLADGNIEFLGRVDHQVKIRGFRVELGEVETILAAHPAVGQSVVIARRFGPDDTRLVAYIVTRDTAAFDVENLRMYCRIRLPEHMVPSAFVHLEKLPLTSSGKVNRTALPAPANARAGGGVSRMFVAPRTAIEEQLVVMWEEILGVNDVGVTDDFFDLGGHSLLAVRLAAQIEDSYGRRFPVSTLAQTRTIERLAVMLSMPETSGPSTPLVDLQPAGANRPFFLVHGIGGEVLSFRRLAHCLAPSQPLYGLRAKGSDSVEEPLPDVESMAAYYLDAIRRVAPQGPYLIGGYSSGGTVALEMAQQLRARGEQAALVVLIDADAPPSDGAARTDLRTGIEYLRNLATWAIDDDFFRAGVTATADRMRSKGRVAYARLQRMVMRETVPVDIRDALGVWQFPDQHRAFLEVHSRALEAYTPRPYDGPMVLLRARTAALSAWRPPDLGWGPLAKGGLSIKKISGAHDNILTEPRVRTLAAELQACLNAAQV